MAKCGVRRQALHGAWILLTILSRVAEAGECAPGPNLEDRDGDGRFDHACVGDWNGNGVCEIEADIQAAVHALDDPGQKTVELAACAFLPPLVPGNREGLLELPSNTLLFGRGAATVLVGPPETDLVSRHGIVSNANHVAGNRNVVVRDLEIDGGWGTADSSPLVTHRRMGIYFERCDGCRAERLIVRDTLHSCLYVRDSHDVEFLDNQLHRCGNYSGDGNTYSCVYIFAGSGRQASRIVVRGNTCDGSGFAALNTRREDAAASLTDLLFENNVVRNTRLDANGLPAACIAIRGVRGAVFRGNRCEGSGLTVHSADEYDSSPGAHADASANVLVDGLVLVDVQSASGLLLQGALENFEARNVEMKGAARSCVQLSGPFRNVRIEDSTFSGCGRGGIEEFGSAGFGAEDDEAMALRRLRILGTGKDGV